MAPAMTKIPKLAALNKYPCLWRWVTEFGTVEIGHCHQTRSFIRVLDEGGMVWKGRPQCRTLDAEAGVSRWMKDQLGIKDATFARRLKPTPSSFYDGSE
jgi:hypothetical protein